MFIRVRQVAIAFAAIVAMSTPAMAATIIDFRNGDALAGGAVTFDGSNVFGANLPIGTVEVFGAPLAAANNRFDVYGTASSSSGAGQWGDLDFNTAANTVSLVGCIPGLGLGFLTEAGGCSQSYLLLSGSIDGETILAAQGALSFWGPDTKHPALLEAIGLAANTPFDLFGFALLTGPLSPTGPARESISTDMRNTAVPEPATMMLLGTGLLAAFKARRRQAA